MTQSTGEQQATIQVEGMTCGHCAANVEKALAGVAGVREAKVDLAGKKAQVRFDPQSATMGRLMAAINAAGYRAVGFSKS